MGYQMLNGIQYCGGGGTEVIANPATEATDDLTKIIIGGITYNIPGDGSSTEILGYITDGYRDEGAVSYIMNLTYLGGNGFGGTNVSYSFKKLLRGVVIESQSGFFSELTLPYTFGDLRFYSLGNNIILKSLLNGLTYNGAIYNNGSNIINEHYEKWTFGDMLIENGTPVVESKSGTYFINYDPITGRKLDEKLNEIDESLPFPLAIQDGTYGYIKQEESTDTFIPFGSGGRGGTEVIANPTEAATDNLTKIKIDEKVYGIPEGGGVDVEVKDTTLKFSGGSNANEIKFATQGSTSQAIRFGIDADGNYGYYKVGADTVTPFKTGGSISGFPYRITTFTFYNQTFEVYQNDILITTATFDENGSAVIVLPAEGEYILKCNGFEKTFNLVYNSKDFSTVPEYFFSTIKLNNPINRLHAVSAGYTTPTITETSAIITACSADNYYYNKMNYIYFDKIPLDEISTIIMKVTRTNNNGRMYMGICNEDIEISFKSNESSIPVRIGESTTTNWGRIKYPSDASGTWSLDVSDITGEYYIFIGHCARSCETSIQEWYWE